jgi:hypothetical protein
MYTGTLIDDLFEAVDRAEKAAAKLPHLSESIEEEDASLVGAGASAQQSRKFSSQAE